MAQQNLIYSLHFNHLKQRYTVNVTEAPAESGYTCYDIQFQSCNCIFLSHYDTWRVIARFDLCKQLKQRVIKALTSRKKRLGLADGSKSIEKLPLAVNDVVGS